MSPFVLNIADLLGRSGASRPERITVSVDWRLNASGLVPEPPLEADLVLQAVPSGILARGTVSFLTRNTCQRCLEVFDEKNLRHSQNGCQIRRTKGTAFDPTRSTSNSCSSMRLFWRFPCSPCVMNPVREL